MLLHFIYTVTLVFLISCTGQDQYRTNHVTEAIEGIGISISDQVYTYLGTDEPVSGMYSSNFITGEKRADIRFLNGMVEEGVIYREDSSIYYSFLIDEEGETTEKKYSEHGELLMKRIYGDSLLGQPKFIQTWHEDGTPIGIYSPELIQEWHSNGTIKSEAHFKDGELHGRVALWHENGRIAGESFYIRGKLDGDYLEWDESGGLITEKKYELGELVYSSE